MSFFCKGESAAQLRFIAERDRRYGEVAEARAEALKIKEQADRDALELAREIQTYKDERSDKMREDFGGERGNYATKDDLSSLGQQFSAALKPITDYISSQQGRSAGIGVSTGWLVTIVTLVMMSLGTLVTTATALIVFL